ncbi:MAG: glycosyl transferase family 1, partial [Fibrobacterota bacterium]
MSSKKGKKLYVQMFSIHGLLRYDSPELGRDSDTGGQIKYVLEEAEELSKREEIEKIDLFTRYIKDKTVSSDYSVRVEFVNEKFNVIRMQCGGNKYMRKELLWPHLD